MIIGPATKPADLEFHFLMDAVRKDWKGSDVCLTIATSVFPELSIEGDAIQMASKIQLICALEVLRREGKISVIPYLSFDPAHEFQMYKNKTI